MNLSCTSPIGSNPLVSWTSILVTGAPLNLGPFWLAVPGALLPCSHLKHLSLGSCTWRTINLWLRVWVPNILGEHSALLSHLQASAQHQPLAEHLEHSLMTHLTVDLGIHLALLTQCQLHAVPNGTWHFQLCSSCNALSLMQCTVWWTSHKPGLVSHLSPLNCLVTQLILPTNRTILHSKSSII